MSVLKATVLVSVLVSLFSGLQSQVLNCPCTGTCSHGNLTVCLADEVCFAAKNRHGDGSLTEEKGCVANDECDDIAYCPDRKLGSVCESYGCCDYDKCVANYSHFRPTPSPTPTPVLVRISSPVVAPAPTSTPVVAPVPAPTSIPVVAPAPTSTELKKPMVSSSAIPEASSSVVPMKTKVPVAMTTPSSVPAKITSMPAMPSMSAVAAMTSPQPEVKPTSTRKMAPSSPAKETSPTPSGSIGDGTYNTQVLITEDPRPPCDYAGRLLSLGTFVLTSIALLLCGMF